MNDQDAQQYTLAEFREVIASLTQRAEAAEGLLRDIVEAWDSAPYGTQSAMTVLHSPRFATAMGLARKLLGADTTKNSITRSDINSQEE